MADASSTGPRSVMTRGLNRLLQGDEPLPEWLAALLVAALLAFSWAATYGAGGAGAVAPHWFYIAILYAAARFGFPGALITGVLAGLAAGPLMPLDVDAGTTQSATDWLSRAGFFIGIGTLMAWLIRRLQRAVRREVEVLEREHELAERSAAVIQSVGHEFRTPLTVLAGTIEMLRSRRLSLEEQASFIDGMGQATRRLGDLVAVVAATSEALYGDVSAMQAIRVDHLCHEIADELEGLGGAQRVEISVGDAEVHGDKRLVKVALRAVVENALKFSDPSTSVHVEASPASGSVEVTVRDRGPGIDPDVVASGLTAPFTPRRETAAAGGGLGLGLFAAGQALDRLGATIGFETPEDGGTRVVMKMPSATSEQPSAHASFASSRS